MSTSSATSNPQLWGIVEQIVQQIGNIPDSSSRLHRTSDTLRRLLDLHKASLIRGEDLQVSQLSLMRERNTYLETLRQIEQLGEELRWDDPDGILLRVRDVLYSDPNEPQTSQT
eukprot:GILJ01009903.1.p1 GENE.GILJ01009903.1~~GILJ01009903.1.p1  ORF type:complete len:114 (-),score=4.98 GILJ01009903.1:147-488(-)